MPQRNFIIDKHKRQFISYQILVKDTKDTPIVLQLNATDLSSSCLAAELTTNSSSNTSNILKNN